MKQTSEELIKQIKLMEEVASISGISSIKEDIEYLKNKLNKMLKTESEK